MTIRILEDAILETVSGGAGNGVITNYGGTPTLGDYTQGRVQDLTANGHTSPTAYTVSSSTGNSAGLFILNPINPQTGNFF